MTDWGEVGTGLRPKEKTLNNRTNFTAVDAGRVDISL